MTSKAKKSTQKVISFGGTANGTVHCTWLQADPVLVVKLIDVCNDCGCAPSFALTSDGGAYRVYFLHQLIPPDERSQYCPGTQDIDQWLTEKIEFWEGWVDQLKGP